MEELVEKIAPLGLTEKEARVYIALLQIGSGSAYSVAIKSGLKKPTAYVILDELIEKGLAYQIPREKKQLYAPFSPEHLIEKVERNVYQAKTVLPELLALFKSKQVQQKARTMYFDGVQGMRQGLEYKAKELHGREVVGFFASARDASPGVLGLFRDWNQYCEKHEISVRGFTLFDESIRGVLEEYGTNHFRQMKVLPTESYSPNVSIDAGDDFVRVNLIGAEQVVIIESADFAQSFRQIFELAWNSFPNANSLAESYFGEGGAPKEAPAPKPAYDDLFE